MICKNYGCDKQVSGKLWCCSGRCGYQLKLNLADLRKYQSGIVNPQTGKSHWRDLYNLNYHEEVVWSLDEANYYALYV